MAVADLPIPGPILGRYPQRREPARSGADLATTGLKRLFDLLDACRPGRALRLLRAVRDEQARLRSLSDSAARAALRDLRGALRTAGLADEPIARAFAGVACASARILGIEPFDTQLIAARIVLDNKLAEMATGEGKTVAVALAAATAALAGIPVHVITANDYLVSRDSQLLGPLYEALGLSVGAVTQDMAPDRRRAAYACDITYCTAKELAFDYLRDSLVRDDDPLRSRIAQLADLAGLAPEAGNGSGSAPLLRGLCMAIVDEADSILIDEARVPLILSRPAGGAQYRGYLDQSLRIARELGGETDFRLDPGALAASLTEAGRLRVEQLAQPLAAVWRNRVHREESVTSALAALHLYRHGRHYLVRDGKVFIIDETTGRLAPGRAWSRGLHQLIELKERLDPTAPLETIAQITFQRFFSRYLRLGGLSGTLRESRGELLSVYRLPVRGVPLRTPCRRVALKNRLFADRERLWDAVVGRAEALRGSGRPLLIGTDSVAESAALSARLTAAGLEHAVLDARMDASEAAIVAAAGKRGAITVATNMAGRGTDIPLGPGVAALGGLHVLNCQLNAARRIDRQLAGRCARQGDPGSVETWLSLDGALMQARLPRLLHRALAAHGESLPSPAAALLSGAIQHFEESRQAKQRRRLLEFDRDFDRRLSFAGRG